MGSVAGDKARAQRLTATISNTWASGQPCKTLEPPGTPGSKFGVGCRRLVQRRCSNDAKRGVALVVSRPNRQGYSRLKIARPLEWWAAERALSPPALLPAHHRGSAAFPVLRICDTVQVTPARLPRCESNAGTRGEGEGEGKVELNIVPSSTSSAGAGHLGKEHAVPWSAFRQVQPAFLRRFRPGQAPSVATAATTRGRGLSTAGTAGGGADSLPEGRKSECPAPRLSARPDVSPPAPAPNLHRDAGRPQGPLPCPWRTG